MNKLFRDTDINVNIFMATLILYHLNGYVIIRIQVNKVSDYRRNIIQCS